MPKNRGPIKKKKKFRPLPDNLRSWFSVQPYLNPIRWNMQQQQNRGNIKKINRMPSKELLSTHTKMWPYFNPTRWNVPKELKSKSSKSQYNSNTNTM
jgi:hypothetical protein